MARPRATLNRIASGIVTVIERDIDANPHLWKRAPVTIVRGNHENLDSMAMPLVAVTITGSGEELEARALGAGRLSATLTLILMTRVSGETNDEAITDLLTDVRRAISGNRQLREVDEEGEWVIPSGSLFFGSYEIGAVEGSDGFGIATQTVKADFVWTRENP